MENEEHGALSKMLKNLKGYMILFGDPSDFNNDLYSIWQIVEKKALADIGKTTEVLWLSPRSSKGFGYQRSDIGF